MSSFTTILIAAIVAILLLLLAAGLLMGPSRPAPDGPQEDEREEDPTAVPPGDGPDRRAGGPGFRSAALALAHRRATDSPRRRRRLARQARSLNAAQSNAVSELGDGDSGVSASRAQRSSAPE